MLLYFGVTGRSLSPVVFHLARSFRLLHSFPLARRSEICQRRLSFSCHELCILYLSFPKHFKIISIHMLWLTPLDSFPASDGLHFTRYLLLLCFYIVDCACFGSYNTNVLCSFLRVFAHFSSVRVVAIVIFVDWRKVCTHTHTHTASYLESVAVAVEWHKVEVTQCYGFCHRIVYELNAANAWLLSVANSCFV